MFPEEFETLSIDHCNKFRRNIRLIFFDIQDVCFSYRDNKEIDLSDWLSFTREIEASTRDLLHTDKFSNRRDPIESLQTKFEKFVEFVESRCEDLLAEILIPLNEMLDSTDDSGLILSTLSLRDDKKKWEEIEKNVRKMRNKISPDLYNRSLNSVIRGRAINSMYITFDQMSELYKSLPKTMSEEERKIFVMQRENESLKRQINVKDTQIKQLQDENKKIQVKLNNEMKAHKDDLRKADVNLTAEQAKRDDLKQIIERMNEQIITLQESYNALRDQNEMSLLRTQNDDKLLQTILNMTGYANASFA